MIVAGLLLAAVGCSSGEPAPGGVGGAAEAFDAATPTARPDVSSYPAEVQSYLGAVFDAEDVQGLPHTAPDEAVATAESMCAALARGVSRYDAAQTLAGTGIALAQAITVQQEAITAFCPDQR